MLGSAVIGRMTPQHPIQPDLLRERAEIARIYAEDMRDPEARRQMLDIALGYDRLAELAELSLPETRSRSGN